MENRKVHFVLFALALLLAATNLFAPTLGFVAPVSGKAVGADLWAALAWLLFLYTSRNLYRSFRKNNQS
jgi:hypothetical protein